MKISDVAASRPVSADPLARLAERLPLLSSGKEAALQTSINDSIQTALGEKVRRAVHGDWLHEPLHAILVEVPVGSWTGTIVFDVLSIVAPSEKLDHAADATLLLGLAGAVGAAATGINDWAEVKSPAARRIGIMHAALNISATGLYAASAILRARQRRSTGRALATAAYLIVSLSAHLGGNMVYEHGIGVARKPGDKGVPTDAMRDK